MNGCGDSKCHRHAEQYLKEIYNGPKGATKTWHDPCPLDQSYYIFLDAKESSLRENSQVITKYLKASPNQVRPPISENVRNVLMVNQMWILKIGSGKTSFRPSCPSRRRPVAKLTALIETIITSFTNCRRDHGESSEKISLWNRLSESFRESPPQSTDAMVLRMIHSAIEYVDAPTYAGFKEDILDMFDKSIAIQVS